MAGEQHVEGNEGGSDLSDVVKKPKIEKLKKLHCVAPSWLRLYG